MLKKLIFSSLLALSTSSLATSLAEKTTTAQDQLEMAVTIYNDNFALIKDSRSIKLDKDFNALAWREVSASMQPETALLRNLTNPAGFSIQEQKFDFDLLTPQKLLEKYTNKEISVIRTNPANGQETIEKATVLATNGGVVLAFSDRIETGIPGRLAFPGVPDNLRDKPTLTASFLSPVAGKQNLELSYLTTGLSWQADYVAELAENDGRLDLNGLVTLTNQSGAAYLNAKLQLVAGDLNRIRQPAPASRKMLTMTAEMTDMPAMIEESLFEYHLYTLQSLTTLAENQTKQVALMSAANVLVNKEFLLKGTSYYYTGSYGDIGQKLKISVFIDFKNKGSGLGIPLPKGIIRIYKKDQQGNAQFIGEDQIDHTPDNEVIRLKLGHAFDLIASRKQTDFKKLAGKTKHDSIFESAYQITLNNAKKEAVTITLSEPIPGDWTILSESQPHKKVSADTVEWRLSIPALSKASLTYRVHVKF